MNTIIFIQIYIGMCLSVIIHEFGHFIFQRMFGVQVTLVEIGFGPRLIKWGWLEVRLFMLSGGVYPNGSLKVNTRWKGVVIALGGIISQWVITYMIGLSRIYRIPELEIICITFFACSMLVLWQLLPFKGQDGYYAWSYIKSKSF